MWMKYFTHYLMLFTPHDAARAERERMINEEKELCRRALLETLKLPVDSDSAKGSSSPPVIASFSWWKACCCG